MVEEGCTEVLGARAAVLDLLYSLYLAAVSRERASVSLQVELKSRVGSSNCSPIAGSALISALVGS